MTAIHFVLFAALIWIAIGIIRVEMFDSESWNSDFDWDDE